MPHPHIINCFLLKIQGFYKPCYSSATQLQSGYTLKFA